MPAAEAATDKSATRTGGDGADDPPIVANLSALRAAIAVAAIQSGRRDEDVTLVAVSKTKPAAMIEAALEAGQRVFGENRVQEAEAKFPALKKTYPDLKLHLIGPLQTNKVHQAIGLFDVIETLDRPKLARALAKEIEKTGRRPRLFIQVNTGEEPQKAGVAPQDLSGFLALARDELGLSIDGLMCIPPVEEPPAPHFALLAKLADDRGINDLSMGMSGDFQTAIHLGATYVRVGSAIFGARAPRPTG